MTITKLHIIDWYDDIITSITSLGSDIYIFNCIQKNFVDGDKTYYCVKIDEESFKQIEYVINKKKFSSKDWNMINLIFEKNNINENVFYYKQSYYRLVQISLLIEQ